MLKYAILKSFVQFYLLIFSNHMTQTSAQDSSRIPSEFDQIGSQNFENAEFENCIKLEGDINGEDPFLNDAIKQPFMVSMVLLWGIE